MEMYHPLLSALLEIFHHLLLHIYRKRNLDQTGFVPLNSVYFPIKENNYFIYNFF